MIPETFTCSPAYVSGACNSNPFASDWGNNNLICVAIGSGVAILRPKLEAGNPGKIENIYFAHKERVNGVKWVEHHHTTSSQHLISTSVDTTAIVWTFKDDRCHPQYILDGHNGAVIDATAINVKLPSGLECILAATMTIDTLVLWKKIENEDGFSRLDTFSFTDVGFGASGLAFSILPDTQTVILACSKKFVNISLYTCDLSLQKDSTYFKEQLVLSGHTNWINDLAFAYTDNGKTLLLASSSHDSSIHIRRIKLKEKQEDEDAALGVQELFMLVEDKRFCVTIYSVLYGHDQWVYSLQWKCFEEEKEDKLKLLSVSADKTIIVWHLDTNLDTWVENYRLGDVGGNVSGFLGGKFSPSGEFIMGHDLRGAFHVWKYNKPNDTWSPEALPCGHFDEVTDIQWDPKGQFLLSVSADKTTRLHAPWRDDSSYWFEFARPQTHGYTISCVTPLPQCRFVSGATEKELRYFVAPKTFVQNFKHFSFLEDLDENKYPHKSAVLPSLDLSNKPADEVPNVNIELTSNGNGLTDCSIPTEDELSRNTLWPEMQKLYYHPNEVSSLASSHDGSLIASACKATCAKHAIVAIWLVKSWNKLEKIQDLSFHQLTVTQLAFSPDDTHLLTVSRDRSWCLFKKTDSTSEESYKSVAYASKTNAIHKRQLQCCGWTHDSKYFATGSRDGKLVIWGRGDPVPDSTLNGFSSQCILTQGEENITSVSFAPVLVKSDYIFAVGYGSGKIGLYQWSSKDKSQCQNFLTLSGSTGHNKAITRVIFRPTLGTTKTIQLASSGSDNLIRIYDLSWSA